MKSITLIVYIDTNVHKFIVPGYRFVDDGGYAFLQKVL